MVKLWSLALALLVGAGAWATPVSAQTSEVDKLQAELSKLRSEVDNLKAVQRQGADDAAPALSTKLNNNVFSWATEDGKFSLTMTNRVQFRVTYNDERGQHSETLGNAADTNGRDFWNFRVRRAKTKFEGNIFEKEWKYLVLLSWANGGNNIVEEAYMTWSKYQEINVSAGQTKVPFEYEFGVSSGKQQFIDRSVVSNTFNQGWGKGLWISGVIGKDTPWVKYWVGVFNGVLRANNDFRNQDLAINADVFSSGAGGIDAQLMPVLRVETHPLGNVADDEVDMRSREDSKKILFSVGVALNWFLSDFNNSDVRPGAGPTGGSGRFNTSQDTINLTLDGHFRFYGLSVNIEYIHRHTEFHNHGPLSGSGNANNRALPGDLTDSGFLFSVGFFILPKQFDVGFRFGWVDSDEFWLGGGDDKRFAVAPDSTEIGLCVGYYIAGHNLKAQLDFSYITYQLAFFGAANGAALNGPGGTLPSRSGNSLANDNADFLNVWQFRIQIQWIF
ncbi:MAG: hypothetical protein KBG84_06085 [Planctomycetes bacterium]|nr:hypothetical protein [Planctomycetota bacterium]